jgi:site-specific DNA-cytosine methylase
MVDYFAGFGGASQSFLNHDSWKVRRFDIYDSGIENLTQIDLLKAPLAGLPFKPDIAWFSPPCDEFSTAFNAIGPTAIRSGLPFEPNLTLVNRVVEIIQHTKPKYFVVENVAGAIPWLEPLFGKYHQIIGPYILWGNFPKLNMMRDFKPPSKTALGPHENRPRLRAIIPAEISEALFDVMNNQRTIYDEIL